MPVDGVESNTLVKLSGTVGKFWENQNFTSFESAARWLIEFTIVKDLRRQVELVMSEKR
jgi:hypothetical protein